MDVYNFLPRVLARRFSKLWAWECSNPETASNGSETPRGKIVNVHIRVGGVTNAYGEMIPHSAVPHKTCARGVSQPLLVVS